MSDIIDDKSNQAKPADSNEPSKLKYSESSTSQVGAEGTEDTSAIPNGTIDPVYEAKARVLNNAVSETRKPEKPC